MAADREIRKQLLNIRCQWCDVLHTIEVFKEDFVKYEQGAHVQDAFPYMIAEIREMFISGTCGECWKKIFSKKKR